MNAFSETELHLTPKIELRLPHCGDECTVSVKLATM